MEAYEYVRQMDRAGEIADSLSHRIREAATTLLCATIRDFALPIARRASKVLGPNSRHHVAQIVPMIRNAARASRPGLAVGILRVLCNGMSTAKRFHVDIAEQTCRVGCPTEPDSLSHHSKCPLLSDIPVTIWRNAGIHLR